MQVGTIPQGMTFGMAWWQKVQEDPGVPMICCSIYVKHFEQCLCDLGASVNIMPKVIYEELQYPALSPTTMLV
jgi:hypothetical protein